MTFFALVLVLGLVALACVKAYCSARLLESNPEAWEKLQAAEFEKHRRRQEIVGKAAMHGIRFVSSLMKKKV